MSAKAERIIQMIDELENPEDIEKVGKAVVRATSRQIRKRVKA